MTDRRGAARRRRGAPERGDGHRHDPAGAGAASAGNAELVKALLGHGADLNRTFASGETPLVMAARSGSVPVLVLLQKGAKVEDHSADVEAARLALGNGAPGTVVKQVGEGAEPPERVQEAIKFAKE